MALRINHNIAALDAQRNLALTTAGMTRTMEKLSSGFRINRASDDPAGLVISEQFRAQVAGLNRAIQNSEGSINMIQTAEGALTEINNLLISMRELAIHAANEGFNDANQLAADQAEINNAIKTIDRISANTQFGTKKLLDGSKANVATITTANTSVVALRDSTLSTGTHSISATKTADATATLNSTSLGMSLASTLNLSNLEEKVHNVDVLQASAGAAKIGDQMAILDAFSNGVIVGATARQALIAGSGAAVVGAGASAAANTWVVTLNYQENGGNPTGDQTINVYAATTDSLATVVSKFNTAINNNTFLAGKVQATAVAGVFQFRSVGTGSQYSVKVTSFSGDTAAAGANGHKLLVSAGSNRGVSEDILNFTITTANRSNTTANVDIQAASSTTYTSMSTLVSALNTALATAFGTVALAAPAVNNVYATVDGSNKLRFYTSDEGSSFSVQLNSTGTGAEEANKVLGLTVDTIARTGIDALVSFDGYTNTINEIRYASTRTATLYNAAAGSAGRGQVDFTVATAANGVNVGNLLLDVKAARFAVRLDAGPATSVIAGKETLIFNADRSQSIKVKYGLDSNGGSETIQVTDQSLVFQIGANVGQTAKIGMQSMYSTSLGKNIAGNMFSSLSNIDVTTVQGAQDAQSVIDQAINEVTEARGTLGSFQKNTLESNLSNLRIAAQNLTASEASIRDTDVAKEMSEFVRNQILLQTGTAMLAQGNQVPQVVLSLFQ
jgi:flagellin